MSRFLEEFVKFIDTQPFDVIRLSELQGDGEIETLERQEICRCQNTYSVSKTFTMTAIGMLYDRGLVKLDEKILDIFADECAEYADDIDERWNLNTVEMALTHKIGVPGGFLDIDTHRISEFGEDFLRYMLTYPLVYTPGTDSKYSDGAFYLLARVVEKKTGEVMDNFLWRELLWPMGFQEMAWSHCPQGHVIGATGLYLHSEDMVRLGQLYLNGGVYKGRRYLSEEWVNLAFAHGFGLDSWDGRVYFKGGMYGQKLAIFPEQKRVIAMQSFGGDSNVVTKWALEYKD
jgi:CubicO group peptidase (beta-lactamase class C family)